MRLLTYLSIKKIWFNLVAILFLNCSICLGQCNSGINDDDILQYYSPPRTSGTITVRVAVHLFSDDFGNGGVTFNEAYDVLDKLASNLEPFDICVSLYSIENTTNSDYLNNGPPFSLFTSTNAIDMFLLPGSFSSCCGTTTNVPCAKMSIFGTYQGVPSYLSHFVSHEFGHCLGLFHTFHGSSCEGGSCLEFVDGSNSANCGDFVTDTPADPCLAYHVDPTPVCTVNVTFPNDPHNDPYNPDPHNIMTYTYPNCGTYFTAGQGQRMRNVLQSVPAFINFTIPEQVYIQNITENAFDKYFFSPGQIAIGSNVTTSISQGNVDFSGTFKSDVIATEFIDFESGFYSYPDGGNFPWLSGYFKSDIDENYCSSTHFKNEFRLISPNSLGYNPLLNNTVWLSTLNGMEGYENSLWTVLEDTSINNIIYKKIFQQYINIPSVLNNPFLNGSYMLYLREDSASKQIFQYMGFGMEQLILDYSLQIGDTMPNSLGHDYTVTSIDSILTNDGYRKRFTFADTSGFPVIWVEGLGNLADPFSTNRVYDTTFANIICVHENGNLVYEFQEMFPIDCNLYNDIIESDINNIIVSVYPNPANDQLNIQFAPFDIHKKEIEIYNITGQLIYAKISAFTREEINISEFNPGIYLIKITEGKKIFSKLISKV